MLAARSASLTTVTSAILAAVLIAGQIKAESSAKPAEKKASRTDPYGDPLPEGVRTRLGTIRFRLQWDERQPLISPDGKILAHADRTGVALLDAVSGRRLHTLRIEGGGGFSPLHFSPDSRLLATKDGHIRVWEVASGKEIWSISLADKEDALDRFSADGKTYLSWSRVKGLRVWEAASGKLLRRLALSSATDLFNTAMSPDGRLLAAPVDAHTLRLWDVGAGKEVRTLARLDRPIDWVLFSPDGRRLAVIDDRRHAIHIWDVKTAAKVLIRSRDEIYPVPMRFSADGKTLVSISTTDDRDPILYAWDTSSGKELWRVSGVDGSDCYFALSTDDRLLADVEEQRIVFRNLRTGLLVRRCATPLAWEVYSRWGLDFSSDGRFMVACDGRALRVWSVATGREREDAPAHLGPPEHIRFSADGRRIAVAARGLVHVWDADTGQATQTFRGHEGSILACLAFSPNGRRGASCGSLLDSTLRVWDADTGRERYQFLQSAVPVHKGTYDILTAFSPDDKHLAVASQMSTQIDVRDAATGKKRISLHSPRYVLGLAFSPTGASLAVSTDGEHHQIECWNIATGKPEGAPLPDGGEMIFSCDGRLLATLDKKTIRVWELASGKAVCTFQFPSAYSNIPWAVSFTPSGALLAATVVLEGEEPWWTDNVLELWDAIRGKRLRRLRVAGNRFEKAAFAPGGRYLATGMADTSVLLWEPAVLAGEPERRRKLGTEELSRLWEELAGTDAERAYRALWTLTAIPDQSVPFLETRMRPAAAGDLPQVIADLDASDFARREAAQKQLIQRGPEAIFGLRAALRAGPTLEMRKRIELILEALKTRLLTPEMLRQMRAVQFLEQVNAPAARRLLERLSRGAPEALLTQEAKSSLERMARQAQAP